MGFTVTHSYSDDFVNLMEHLGTKYGKKIFDLDGIGLQLDFNAFRENFFGVSVAADGSVDPNANVDDVSPITFTAEFSKPSERLDSYYVLYSELLNITSKQVADEIIEHQLIGDIYINDMHGISSRKPYCFNYATFDVLTMGLPMVNKIVSLPPKHLLAFRSQLEQFITIASNSTLGATGMADLLISMSFYMRHILDTKSDAHFHFATEEDCWEYFRQTLISFIYTMNQPMRANQSPFSNVSIYDRAFLENLVADIIFPDGTRPDVDLIMQMQDVYIDTMNDEMARTPITFPVTTLCLSTEDGEIKDPEFLEKVSPKAIEYGFLNVYMGSSSTLSSCCRLRSSTKNEFFNSFGAGSSKIGSLGVVTINLPRLAYLSKDDADFEDSVKKFVRITAMVNQAKRNIIQYGIDVEKEPLYNLGFMELNKQYSTTGINGLYECLDILGHNILTEDGQDYATHLLSMINEVVDECQEKYRKPHNIEQIPGENTSIKFCRKDKYLGYDLGLEMYSNQFVPLTSDVSMLDRILIQGKLDQFMSGGSVLHLNVAEKLEDPKDFVDLVKFCAQSGVIYFAINYLLNKCENGHMTIGLADKCPTCGAEIIGKYTRVVGFLTEVSNWHKVRREKDFPNRRFYQTTNFNDTRETLVPVKKEDPEEDNV